MTSNSSVSTTPSADTTTVLPVLSELKAPLTLSLTIDKSVSKVAAWVMVAFGAGMALIGAGCVLAVWMIIAYRETEREVRLQRLETDEMNVRLEKAGIPRHDAGDSP